MTVARLRLYVEAGAYEQETQATIERGLEFRASNYSRWYGAAGDLLGDANLESAGTASSTAIRSLDQELEEIELLRSKDVDYVIYHGIPPGVDPRLFVPQWEGLLNAVR